MRARSSTTRSSRSRARPISLRRSNSRSSAGSSPTPPRAHELECGPDPTLLEHNCSGKHAGFLALCRAQGWPSRGYRLADHPCQQAMLREIASAAEVDPGALRTAVDGCGVLTFALPLRRAAHAFARLGMLEGGDRIVRAMRAHAHLLRGPSAIDVRLIASLDGWVAKGGAKGVLCAASPGGLGIALKVVDGSFRAVAPAAAHLLARLGLAGEGLGGRDVLNSLGERGGGAACRLIGHQARRKRSVRGATGRRRGLSKLGAHVYDAPPKE